MKKLIVFLFLSSLVLAQTPSILFEMSYFPSPASPDTKWNDMFALGYLKYTVVVCGWGSIDQNGTQGGDTWTACDNAVKAFTTPNPTLKVGIVISPVADVTPNSSTFTPAFVANNVLQHGVWCSSYLGDNPGGTGHGNQLGAGSSADYTLAAVAIDPPFANAYAAFVPRALAHFASASYASQLGYIVFGEGRGGEAAITCSTDVKTALGLANDTALKAAWYVYADALNAAYSAAASSILAFDSVTCLSMITANASTTWQCDFADQLAQIHAKYGIGFRFTCIRTTDMYYAMDGAPTCGDWVSLLQKYAVPVDFQDSTQSDPTGGSCAEFGLTSISGNLMQLVPYQMQNRGRATRIIYELYSNDVAYASSSFTPVCFPAGFVTGAGGYPYAPYDQVFRNAIRGQPLGSMLVK